MRVVGTYTVPGMGGFFYEDQAAIRQGAVQDGDRYLGRPVTPGFTAIRQPATALCIGLLLDDGYVAWADCVSVQYAAAAGRDSLATDPSTRRQLADIVLPHLEGRVVDDLRDSMQWLASLGVDDKPI